MHRYVERAVPGDLVVAPDELVQFYIVDVSAFAQMRCVQDDEAVLGVGVNLGYVVAFHAIVQGSGMEPERLVQDLSLRRLTHRDTHPDDRVVASGEQIWQFGHGFLLEAGPVITCTSIAGLLKHGPGDAWVHGRV